MNYSKHRIIPCFFAGLTEPTDVCDAGYVCQSAAQTARPTDGTTGHICEQGAYCPKGSDQAVNCPAGTFSDQTGLHNMTECQDCLPGQYCNIDGECSLSVYSGYRS